VQHAANVATGTVWLRAGTYSGGITVTRSGITFEAYPGELAAINGGAFGFRFYKVTSGAVRFLTIQNANSSGGAGVIVDHSSNVTVANSVLRYNKNYGVRTWNSTNTIIRNSHIYKNQEGIRLSYASGGTQILSNLIYSQDTMFNNDTGGGVGITFLKTTGKVLVAGNQLWLNRAKSHRFVYDGSAFEIFGASDVTITGNIAWNNKVVMETGTRGLPCNNLTFTRNIGFAASTVKGYARGLVIACASNSLIANNTLDGFDISDISVVDKPGYRYQGSLKGLKIENNILRTSSKAVFYFDHLPSYVTIDYNLIWNSSGGSLVYIVGKGNTSSFATLKSWIGRMTHGVWADPKFYNGATHDYRLAVGSAAIDRGVNLGAITPFVAPGPDMGRWEMR
jgi:parallel beta-helix repeat protein